MRHTKDEWKKILSDEVFEILWNHGTEEAFSGEYVKEKRKGTYECAGCGNILFRSDDKFESGTGWPSFVAPFSLESVQFYDDTRFGMKRVEVICKRCGGHLGHVFDDGPLPFKKRYCMNSLALRFVESL
ncbi:MAG: peptide-methionine (R)-S-oxide reductase MsrB [Thermoplasmatota archaeon]|jgi:peptide-methionine (R)-S-oxide reductase